MNELQVRIARTLYNNDLARLDFGALTPQRYYDEAQDIIEALGIEVWGDYNTYSTYRLRGLEGSHD